MRSAGAGALGVVLKTGSRIRHRGPKEVAELGWGRLREQISSGETLHFFVRPAGGVPCPVIPGWALRQASAADATGYVRRVGTESASTFRRRLEGARCYLVLEKGDIMHSSWVATGPTWTRELRLWVRPPSGDAYIYESFTHPEARGRGIYPFALANILLTLEDEGARRAWIAADSGNAPSLRSISKAGFEPAFDVVYRRRWGRVLVGEPQGPEAAQGAQMLGGKLPREK